LVNINNVSNIGIVSVIQRIKVQYVQNWTMSLNMLPKLNTYRLLNTLSVRKNYLDCILIDCHRIALSKLRCSSHCLAIEEGRYRDIAMPNRVCTKYSMNVVENEYHFIFVCPFFSDLRKLWLPKYFNSWPNIVN